MTEQTELQHNLDYLKLPWLAEHVHTLTSEAAAKQLPPVDFLSQAVAGEANAKRERAAQRRLKQAHFPYVKTIDSFKWSHPDKINRDLVQHLFGLRFIKDKRNVAFIGAPGLGKTHLGIALACKACMHGYSVRFDTAIDIINRLEAARQAGTFVRAMRAYTGPDLLCIDEVGFLPIDQRGADLLFQVISTRYERGSIILTSNRAFKDWAPIFNNDATIASAVLDRLLHHCDAVSIKGKSYRMNEPSEQ